MEERLDGTLRMISRGEAMKFGEITEKQTEEAVPKTDLRVYSRPPKPSKDHPWKRKWKPWNSSSYQRVSAYSPKRTFLNWLDISPFYD
ncbi:MAG: hypothetical protein FJ139_09940 [Deltaproteobacteria bacterium]|nr:hypothetical protein [Deltaproteobacteria bacterium]